MPEHKPVRVEKPWGYELIWAHTDRYVGKILHVRKGHALSLQYHRTKDETVHLLSGRLELQTSFRILLERFPRMEPVEEPRWKPSYIVRGLAGLRARLG